MTVSWASKDPNEVRSYRYSWLGRLNGAQITSATLAVANGTVLLSNIANTSDSVSATVSGGQDCEDVAITSTIVTDAGETLEESITLRIRPSYFLNVGPSTSTKRQIVEMSYEECSLAGYEFDLTPEETFAGLRRLDALMAQWNAESIDLNYNFPHTFGAGDLEDYSGIPDAAITAVAVNLAMAHAPAMGKSMSAEARVRLTKGMLVVRAMSAKRVHVGWGLGTPSGAGNRFWPRRTFMPVGTRCR